MPFLVHPMGGQLEGSTPFQYKDTQTQLFFAKLKTISLGHQNGSMTGGLREKE